MRSTFLLALAWPSRIHHAPVRDGFAVHHAEDWATCPLTQLGFVRVSFNPMFMDGAVKPLGAREVLAAAAARSKPTFRPDAVDLTAQTPGLPRPRRA